MLHLHLLEWARRKGLEVETIIANPEEYADLYVPITRQGIESFIDFPPRSSEKYGSPTSSPSGKTRSISCVGQITG